MFDLAIYCPGGNSRQDDRTWPSLSMNLNITLNSIAALSSNPFNQIVVLFASAEEFIKHQLDQTKVLCVGDVPKLAAYNEATRRMKGRYFMFVDSGIILNPQWLKELVELINTTRVGLVEGDDEFSGLTIKRELYEGVGGTSETSVIEKIYRLALEQDATDILLDKNLNRLDIRKDIKEFQNARVAACDCAVTS